MPAPTRGMRRERRRTHRLPDRRRRPDRPRLGDGLDLNVEALGKSRTSQRFLIRLASFSRLILFDKRGVGPPTACPRTGPEPRDPDGRRSSGDGRGQVRSRGHLRRLRVPADGDPVRGHVPERTIGLILYGTFADYAARSPSTRSSRRRTSSSPTSTGNGAPGTRAGGDPHVGRAEPRGRRAPGPVAGLVPAPGREPRSRDRVDAHEPRDQHLPALPAIHVPTLVFAKTDDLDLPIRQVREMTDRYPAPGWSTSPATSTSLGGEYDGVLDEIERFVAG